MGKFLLLITIIFCYSTAIFAADAPDNFNQAKNIATKIYQQHPSSFYCNCKIKTVGKKLVPDLNSCGYQARKDPNRASRIEWEHIVPAWEFGHQLKCWQNGGRKNCKKDPTFNKMEADLNNLVPALGEVNGNRSNYRFAMLEGEPRNYGKCDIEIDSKAKKVEPRPEIRGDIARIYFYMYDKYGLKMSPATQKLLAAWNKEDKIDQWEIEKNMMIKKLTGSDNKYVSNTTLIFANK